MASLSGIMNIASSALQTAQTGLNVVSDNVSNVNTAGYVRKVMQQESLVYGGVGQGVGVAKITRAADQFLQQASLDATANSGNYGAISANLDQAQKLFGDPANSGSLFDQLDQVFSAFSSMATAPSGVQQTQSISALTQLFNNASQISNSLSTIQAQTDARITSDVSNVNDLLSKIDSLNADISRGSVSGHDVTGYENQQSQYIDQLSKLIDIKVSPATGLGEGVTIRASDGTALTGIGRGPAVFNYDQTNGSGQLMFTPPGGQLQPFGSRLTSGEIEGLLHSRNTDIPNLTQQLGEFTASTASAINKASNAYSPTPAPTTLTGNDTGLDVPSAIAGFTGKTTVAVVNASGVIQSQVAIDFTAGTMSVNGGAATAFTPANFVSSLNTALGASGTASVNGNVLSISATGTNGVAIADDATTPSQAGGKGFSQYFGFNDVVSSASIADYDTGLSAASLSGFNSGSIKFRIASADGTDVADVSVTPTPGQTLGAMVTQLNANSGGVGLYGSFALDSYGAITFTPKPGTTNALSVVSDTTTRNGTGPSYTTLFGVDPSLRAGRTTGFSVKASLVQQPGGLPNAALNLSAAAGTSALSAGDNKGYDALAQAGQVLTRIHAAGQAAASTISLSDYSASFSARIGSAAATAAASKTSADSNATAATAQRSSVEGVNLDEELISLTTYQQAYNASARLITAAKDMYDALLQMVP